MPEGVVQWFDPSTGEARILHGGRRYTAATEDVESAARVAGARVHFDIDASSAADVARNVRLRTGTRVSPRQGRFGDLSGARHPEARGSGPPVREHPRFDTERVTHPLRLVQRWVELLAAGDLDGLLGLYAPDASLHVNGDVVVGRRAIGDHWVSSPILGRAEPSSIRGDEGHFTVRWTPPEGTDLPAESRMRVDHGEITEQWLGAAWTLPAATGEPDRISMSVAGAVTDSERLYAIDKVRGALETTRDPVLFTSIRLERAPDPARARPALARVIVDLNGQPVRAHVAAGTVHEAIDLLAARLRHRLEHLASHREALHRRGPVSPPGEWRHGDAATTRPDHYPRPRAEREIVRRKTFSAPASTIDEAVFDLEAMDHDFFVFTDLATGRDAIVHRLGGDGSYRLGYVGGPPAPEDVPPVAAPVESEDHPAPRLSLHEARERLDSGHEPWVFFEDAATGRGHALYRRYDGHYGLITPAGEPPASWVSIEAEGMQP